MDYGLIIKRNDPVNNIDITNNMYYRSSRILLSSEGQFGSKYQWLIKDSSNKFINHPELNKELNNLYVFAIDQ